MSNTHHESPRNLPDDSLANSLPAHSGPYRSLSAKRLRDPSHRKSVSFNDVPIVHEVPSHDAMRNSNSDIYRSWTFTDTTSPISVPSPFSSPHALPPFNSTNATAQKQNANRLSSVFYSSSSAANTTTFNRLSDWSVRTRTVKPIDETTDSNTPLIVIHRPEEQRTRNSYLMEHSEERRHSYRSPTTPDSEHYRTLPFTYVPLSESTTTYTSMLSNNYLPANEQTPNGSARSLRARSATLPITITNSSLRNHENISITPLRPTPNTIPSNSASRTVLKPATIAFHGSTNTSTSKAPAVPPRSHSFVAHSRLSSSSNRPLSSSTNKRSTPSTTLSRARSAYTSSTKRQTASPILTLDGPPTTATNNNSTNLYTTTKRNPNLKPTYASSSPYMHHILLPANIN